jgi:hypothetical protein
MMAHILIDFETLGQAQNGKVTYCAYASFNIDMVEPIEEIMSRVSTFKFNWLEQDEYELDESVIEFWKKQPFEIRNEMLGSPETGRSISEFLDEFADFFFESKFNATTDILWSRGNSFDITILNRLYSDNGKEPPYPFWRVRDARTWVDAANVLCNNLHNGTYFTGKFGKDTKSSNHSAVFDVAKDVEQIQRAYSVLESEGIYGKF